MGRAYPFGIMRPMANSKHNLGDFPMERDTDFLHLISFRSLFRHQTIRHFVSTRTGGQSNAPYDSLNLGYHVGDNPEHVLENRKRLALAVGIPLSCFTLAKQIHSGTVAVVSEAMRGRGSTKYEEAIETTDAMVTDVPGICLVILVADCVPMLFFDPVKKVIGVAHAGWKGTLQSIALHTVGAMENGFGSSPHNIIVGMGPSIGPCCYEVGPEVISHVKSAFSPSKEYLVKESKDGKGYLDLWRANLDQLLRAGIQRKNIEMAMKCTCHNPDLFFSYRHQKGGTGRFGAGISIL